MDKGMSMRIQHNLEAEKTIKRVLLGKKKKKPQMESDI